jgi:hypothetical protein
MQYIYSILQSLEQDGVSKERVVKALWAALGDIPIDDDEAIDIPFLHFLKGTDRYEIWHWFEDTFDISVHELMYPNEHK